MLWRVVACWTPADLAERQLILGSSKSGCESPTCRGAVGTMLRDAYELGELMHPSASKHRGLRKQVHTARASSTARPFRQLTKGLLTLNIR